MIDEGEGRSNDGGKQSFSSTCSTYVTILGYTVGMSDIWRVPFLVYRNGGGAFFIPFLLTMFLCGIPLFFMEYAISNFSGKGPYLIWDMCPLFRGVGTTMAVLYMMYMAGTSIFRGWLSVFLVNSFQDPLPWTHCNNDWNTAECRSNHFVDVTTNLSTELGYATNVSGDNVTLPLTFGVNYTEKSFMTAAEEFWQYESLHLSAGITDLGGIQWRLVLAVAILRVLVMICVSKSMASIEKVMYLFLFAPLLFMVAMLIQSLMLPGASAGLYKYFYPDFSKLFNPRIWIEAFLMVFYTLSFGWGAILTLGSHSNFKDNCIRTSLLLPLLDAMFAILNGAVCFSVLGNMAYSHGVEVDEVLTTGFAAGVVSYVTSLSSLPFPQIWNVAFFVTAIMAGLDSQIIPVEMCVQIIGEMYPKLYPRYRTHILCAVSTLLFVMALPTCTRAGGYIFLWCDWYIGVWAGPICAFIEVITVAWIYGMDRFNEDVKLMTGRNIPGFFRIAASLVAPVLVTIIFLTSCVEYVPPKYGDYSYPSWARGLGWVAVAFILLGIVLKAGIQLKSGKGPLPKRLHASLRETSTWGPKEASVKDKYVHTRSMYKRRTMKTLLRYIVFGSAGTFDDAATQQELTAFT